VAGLGLFSNQLFLNGVIFMQYMGSKNRLAKHLLPVMLPYRKNSEQCWIEPFVGGANMIDKIAGDRLGNDNHPFLIALLQAVSQGYDPPSVVTKDEYYRVKSNPNDYPSEYVGFVGFLCSFGYKWWGGYAFNKEGRNYAEKGRNALLKQAPNIKGVKFQCQNYLELIIPNNSIVYCDPPYQKSSGYHTDFDHQIFWDWCRSLVQNNNIVFVSEYSAPDDFVCTKEIVYETNLNKNSKSPRIERLFLHRSQIA
jgi:DNA adenine methylase